MPTSRTASNHTDCCEEHDLEMIKRYLCSHDNSVNASHQKACGHQRAPQGPITERHVTALNRETANPPRKLLLLLTQRNTYTKCQLPLRSTAQHYRRLLWVLWATVGHDTIQDKRRRSQDKLDFVVVHGTCVRRRQLVGYLTALPHFMNSKGCNTSRQAHGGRWRPLEVKRAASKGWWRPPCRRRRAPRPRATQHKKQTRAPVMALRH